MSGGGVRAKGQLTQGSNELRPGTKYRCSKTSLAVGCVELSLEWLFFQNTIQVQLHGGNPPFYCTGKWSCMMPTRQQSASCSFLATVQLVRSPFRNTKLSGKTPQALPNGAIPKLNFLVSGRISVVMSTFSVFRLSYGRSDNEFCAEEGQTPIFDPLPRNEKLCGNL